MIAQLKQAKSSGDKNEVLKSVSLKQLLKAL